LGSYISYLIGAIIMFGIYWYFSSKVKTHSNYVAVWAITIGFMVYMAQSNIAWIIENINKHTSLELSVPKPTSDLTLLGFGVFLLVIVWIYHRRKKENEDSSLNPGESSQKNSFKSWFNFGNVEQTNERK